MIILKHILTYKLFEEYKISTKKELYDPEFSISKEEFLNTLNGEMPDELLEMIYNWDFIKKSPYNNKSYYNGAKSWGGFVDGGIRVSDHWNFVAPSHPDNVHCKTKQKDIINNTRWYVGVYDKETDLYDLIEDYPIITGRKKYESPFFRKHLKEIKKKRKEMVMPSPERIEELQDFKRRYKEGLVKAKLDSGEIVNVIWRGKRGYESKAYYVIKYIKDGEEIETPNYTLVDEVLEK